MKNNRSEARQFRTKQGLVSDYALSCGYIDTFELNSHRIILSKEHNTYHIKNISNEHRYWVCFDTLKEARSAFKNQISLIKGELK